MIKVLAQIDSGHFCAGIVLFDDRVFRAAPILHYMAKGQWTRDKVRTYCQRKGWKISVVYQREVTEPQGKGLG